MKPGHYSEHFTAAEMRASETAARRGWANVPPPEVERNLRRLCVGYLENLRARFGRIRVTSGYRCPELNAAIGGSSSSAHMDGRAADLQPLQPGARLEHLMDWIVASRLDFDQVIYEFGGWIHLGIASEGLRPRRQALMIFHGTGYLPFDGSDPRVRGGA